MYSVFSFSSKQEARRCVRYCREFGVVVDVLPKSRFYDGVAQLRVNTKFQHLVYGAFSPFICSCLVYA